ncbi:MAG: MFS transporter [Sporolactobacillus sp.]|nr:MFS transporter [Sporolactobacillus sp.]
MFGAQGAFVIFTTVFTFYIVYVLGQASTVVSVMNSLNSILQICAALVFIFICAKKGFMAPNQLALGAVIVSVLLYGGLYLLSIPSSSMFLAITIITILMGAAMGGTYYIPWTVFMADIDELVTNRRREGILPVRCVHAIFLKAILLFAIGAILSVAGFKEGLGAQPKSAIDAIVLLLVIGTAGFTAFAVWCTDRLEIFNQKTHKIALDEVQGIHNGGPWKMHQMKIVVLSNS